jgi:hypothetical protein
MAGLSADSLLWWLALAGALPLLATPLLVTIRRSGGRRLPLFVGRHSVRLSWWAFLLTLSGFGLLFAGARGLGGREDGLLYLSGAGVVSVVVTTGLVIRHNRRVAADSGGTRDGVQPEPLAGHERRRQRPGPACRYGGPVSQSGPLRAST